jgi:hypothetical protein
MTTLGARFRTLGTTNAKQSYLLVSARHIAMTRVLKEYIAGLIKMLQDPPARRLKASLAILCTYTNHTILEHYQTYRDRRWIFNIVNW